MKSRLRFHILLGASLLALQALAGSFSSLVAGTKTSTGTGSWNTAGTWSPSGVPGAGDSVVIAAGHIVTLNTNGTCGVLNVLGTLTYDATLSRSLSVTTSSGMTGNVWISGTFDMGNGSSQTASVAGNFANNGTFTAGTSTMTFTGATSTTVSGTSTTNFSSITINKGSSSASILDVQSVITMASNGLTFVNGTFKLSSNSTITPVTTDLQTSPYRIPSTAGLWVNGGTVSTTSDLSFAGLIRVSNGTLNIGDLADERLNVFDLATLTIEGGTINIAGRFTRPSSTNRLTFAMSGGILTVPTLGSTSITYPPFNENASGSSFTMSGGTIVIRRSGGSNLGYTNLAGTTNVTGGTIQIGDGSSPASQTILINSTAPIWNLTVNGANSPTAQLSTNSPLAVKNNVTLTSGSLNANNLALIVGGNWTNNASAGAFVPGSGTVTFSGSSTQSIGGSYSTTFHNLTLNNGAGVTLGASISMNDTLNLTSGNLTTDANTVTIGSSGSALGTLTRTSGTIIGTLKRWFAASTVNNVLFPVGIATNYRPANLSFTAAPSVAGTVAGTFVASDPGSNGLPLDDAGFSVVNRGKDGYWIITSGDGLTGGTYNLDLTADGFEGVQNYTTLRILKRVNSSSPWTLNGTHAAGTGSNQTPTAHRTGMSGFSEFGIGGGSGNPLPVQLSSFTGRLVSVSTVVLEWSTVSEVNNYGFEVQRKGSGNADFSTLSNSFVPGHSTTLEPQRYSFTDASATPGHWSYRLKQMDLDGSVHYTDAVSIDVLTDVKEQSLPTAFALEQNYPNPFNPSTVVRYQLPVASYVTLKVYNLLGQEVMTLVDEEQDPGTKSVKLNANDLTSGVYFYKLTAGTFSETKTLTLVK